MFKLKFNCGHALSYLSVFCLAVFYAVPLAAAEADPAPTLVTPLPQSAPVIGGTQSADGDFPFMVALLHNGNQECGGSLIGTKWVLTAAHCFFDEVTGLPVDTTGRSVWVGINDLSGAGGVVANVTQIILHPNYDPVTYNNDICLLELDTQVYGLNVQSISLPAQGDPLNLAAPGVIATSCGWGNSGSQASPVYDDNLLDVDLPIVSNAVANLPINLNGAISSNMLAAGDIENGGIDTCQGDSGGPLFIKRFGRFVQLGIVSWGNGCADPHSPGVYARVSYFSDWIAAQIGDPLSDYPQLDIAVPAVSSSNTVTISLEFSEDVMNVVAGEFSVSAGSLSNFQTLSASSYTIDYTATGSEGAETIVFTPGNVVDTDEGYYVHYQTQEILIDNHISNVTTNTGVLAVGLSMASSEAYSAEQLGLDGLQIRAYNAESGSYYTPSSLAGLSSYWVQSGTALSLQAPTALTATTTDIPLKAGWNFFSTPYHDSVAWDVDTVQVRTAADEVMTLAEAVAAGLVEDYVWWYDSNAASLVPINDPAVVTMPGSVATVDPWKPYWIRAYADLDLLIPAVAQPYPVMSFAVHRPGSFTQLNKQ